MQNYQQTLNPVEKNDTKNVSLEKSLLNIDFLWWQLRENKKKLP